MKCTRCGKAADKLTPIDYLSDAGFAHMDACAECVDAIGYIGETIPITEED
jgi:hypothetical protein